MVGGMKCAGMGGDGKIFGTCAKLYSRPVIFMMSPMSRNS